MLSPQPYFQPRGTPISVNQRLTALSNLGHEVDLITYHLGEDTPLEGLTIHRIPRIPFITNVRIGPSRAKLFLDVLLFLKALVMLVRRKYDVIHTHEEAAFMGMLLSKIFGCRHIYDMHSSLPRQLENFQFGNIVPIIWLFEVLERLTLRTADAIVTVDKELDDYVRGFFPNAKVHRIENRPVLSGGENGDPRKVSVLGQNLKGEGRFVVVYTGNFERYQGLEMLVQALGEIKDEVRDIALILVGGTDEQINEMRDFVKQHGLEEQSVLVGRVSVAEAFAYLAIADVLVSPRVGETTTPLKIYSYISAGKPILASNVPAHSQLLDDSVALLVEPTKEGLARGLKTMMEDDNLRRKLGEKSLRLAGQLYSKSTYLAQIEKVYKEASDISAFVSHSTRSIQD